MGLGLKECAPTEINIGEQRFDVANFRWSENGFLLSFNKDSSIYDPSMQLLRSGPKLCALKFADLSVNFDCFVKSISGEDYQNIIDTGSITTSSGASSKPFI